MSLASAIASLREQLPADRLERDAPLARYTTFRVGGPADILVHASRSDHIVAAVRAAREAGVPLTMLGGGSNVLVADAGIRGIVLRVHGGELEVVAADTLRAGAGVTINGAVRFAIGHGLAGLESWAGTPGTIGGAIRGNAHFQGRNIGELVRQVELLSPAGEVGRVAAADMAFAYDFSRVQRTGEIVLSADFAVSAGDPAALRSTARQSLAFRKRTQPLDVPSAGCIFQNPDPRLEAIPDGIPASAGALVDRAGLKGVRDGGAMVSPTHGNFIVTDGSATAADVFRLVQRCRSAVRERFGVELRDEIVCLGF